MDLDNRWFGPDVTVYSVRSDCLSNPAGQESWFYEGDWKITLLQSWVSMVEPERASICGAWMDEENNCPIEVVCLLPPDHECKHLPCTMEMAEAGVRITGVRIQRELARPA